jgi:alpha-galactosidase
MPNVLLLIPILILLIAITHCGHANSFGPPPNSPAEIKLDETSGKFRMTYGDKTILDGQLFFRMNDQDYSLPRVKGKVISTLSGNTANNSNPIIRYSSQTDQATSVSGKVEITQKITLSSNSPIVLKARVFTSEEGFPCELSRRMQERFPIIRNTVGEPSRNLRNDAIYERKWDWVISATSDQTAIKPSKTGKTNRQFDLEIVGTNITLTFMPRFYQIHKNIQFFEPWTYKVWQDSVCGWCSWWPYRTEISEEIVARVCDVFAEKLRDYGFEYIQIDDGYQSSGGGLPEDWLNTNRERFPGGLAHLAEIIRQRGLKPALWVNVHFGNAEYVQKHKDWFVTDQNGEPYKGNWIDYGLDGSVPEAVDSVVRPTYRALKQQGWKYIKVDTLRHLLYDCYYPCRSYFDKKGVVAEVAFRNYLSAIREELGRDTYMLACWGVLPEVVGIADGCRLGGDGFGPTTFLQYNSWNNIVWRNDPDHMDITPEGEEWIRPVTVTMAGAQMLLTDKVEVYQNDAKIEGAKRCAPVLFTVPGQLYDFDPTKTDNVKAGKRNESGGGPSGPIDADQHGKFCEWWLLEINRPFDSWNILARMDYKDLPRTEVRFTDLGLPDDKEYLVFEYRTSRFLGSFKGSFTVPAQRARDVSIYAIREKLGRPQLLATSRHVTCGGPDLQMLKFENGELTGVSQVVGKDIYKIYIYLPAGTHLGKVSADKAKVINARTEGQMAIVELLSEKSATVKWTVETF